MSTNILCQAKFGSRRDADSSKRPGGVEDERRKKVLRNFVRFGGAAVLAVGVCSPMLLAEHPKTPLRVLCIAAFEYLARLRGGTLGPQRRMAMAYACDFGSLRDAYYDEQRLNVTEYRLLRSALRRTAPEGATKRYIQELRKEERGRPTLGASADSTNESAKVYRVAVIELSLRWLEEISGLRLDGLKFDSLASLICLMQLADDLLDWRDDLSSKCPSYVTALLLEQSGKEITEIKASLRARADEMLLRTVTAAREDAGAVPFALAGRAVWALIVALLKVCTLR